MNKVKDIVSENSEYKKHNSFDALNIRSDKKDNVINKINNIDLVSIKDIYRREIVQKAIKELNESSKDSFKLFPNVIEEMSRIDEQNFSRYLFYRYRYEMFPKQMKLDEYPPCIQIEPVSSCNYRCVFCYQTDDSFTSKSNGHMGMMDLDLFKRTVDQAEGNVESITLASRGEPLMHKDIGEMLAYLSGKFLAVKMNTNASLLNEKKCHEILSSGIQTLVISADAADDELYSQLRVNGKLSRVLKNLDLFNSIKENHYKNSNLITRVSGVKVNSSQSIDDMEGLWGKYVEQIAFVNYNPWENTYEREVNSVKTPCSDLWRRVFVWFDGIFNPCDVDYKSHLSAGNVNDSNISNLWTGHSYNRMRELHLGGERNQLDPCLKCTVI